MKNITAKQFSILGDCGKIHQFMKKQLILFGGQIVLINAAIEMRYRLVNELNDVIIKPGVDIYNTKTIRSSMGAWILKETPQKTYQIISICFDLIHHKTRYNQNPYL